MRGHDRDEVVSASTKFSKNNILDGSREGGGKFEDEVRQLNRLQGKAVAIME